MTNNIFNPKKLEKLNNPDRLKAIPPEFIWGKLNLVDPRYLLDLGAGTGMFSIAFSHYIERGMH